MGRSIVHYDLDRGLNQLKLDYCKESGVPIMYIDIKQIGVQEYELIVNAPLYKKNLKVFYRYEPGNIMASGRYYINCPDF